MKTRDRRRFDWKDPEKPFFDPEYGFCSRPTSISFETCQEFKGMIRARCEECDHQWFTRNTTYTHNCFYCPQCSSNKTQARLHQRYWLDRYGD